MLFKATTRRTRYLPGGTKGCRFEGFIHEALPLPSFFPATADASAHWVVAIPEVLGAALFYGVHQGPYDSEGDALAQGLAQMRRGGWRDTREQADADMAAEIEYRSTHRADGSLRLR